MRGRGVGEGLRARECMRVGSWVYNAFTEPRSLGAVRVQELCESRGGRRGLSVLMSLTVFVDVKQY